MISNSTTITNPKIKNLLITYLRNLGGIECKNRNLKETMFLEIHITYLICSSGSS